MHQLALPHFPFDKRWTDRNERWVAPDTLFSPAEFGVEVIPERQAKAWVVRHHYSGTMPAARLCIGLKRKTGVASARLVGVAVFSVPMQQRVVPHYTGLAAGAGVELGRFVLAGECAFNAESWMIAKAFALLRHEKPEVRAIVSYADPVERRTPEGHLCKPAHRGQIYQASNALFVGRSSARTLIVGGDGRALSERALSKIRNGECGHDYAVRQLLAAGAPARRPFEDPRDWLARVLQPPLFRRMRHPGNYTYLFALDGAARAQIALLNAGGLPYPAAPRVAGHADDAMSSAPV